MKTKFKFFKQIIITALVIGITSSCKEKVVDLNSISLDKTTATVMVGATINLGVVFFPFDATNQNIIWESDNGNVTVEDGVVTGVSLGTSVITATSEADNTIMASCTVTILPSNGQQITVSGDITSNTTWYANARYFLDGFVFVKSGANLTIEPGTIIKGKIGTKGALIIERGSKITAIGTSFQPIIFTSAKEPGSRAAGDWGGLVLCGYATTNKSDGGSAGVGLAEGGIGSLYGGTNDADNSGVLQYVRIEFPGIALTSTQNSEINGLTLYAVGSGTTIDHIQVSYSGDDSYEWFGGTVNCKYLVAIRGTDDDFDTDNGFRGNVQFALGIRDPQLADAVSGSNGFESDNNADGSSTAIPITAPVFSNVTLFGPYAVSTTGVSTDFKRAMHLRRSTQLSVYNSIFVGWPKGLLIDGALGNTPTMADNNILQIENCILAGMGANYEAASGTPAIPYSIAQIQAYFESTNPDRKNDASKTVADIIGANLLSLTSPSLLPAAGSSFLTGASYVNSKLSSFFIEKTGTFLGAFGTTNWTSGWCNFDPQTTVY